MKSCFIQRCVTHLTVVVAILLIQPASYAGSADQKVGVDRFGEVTIRDFALKLNDALDARKVNVAIIARTGRPRSELPRGISYTHVAFAVFEAVQGADGVPFYIYTVYNLYQGEPGQEERSFLKQDLIYNFVAGVYERDVAVCVPTEALQRRILAVIRSPAYGALHIADYNLVANPWVDRYDNCVTHTLKVCMAGIYQTTDRARIYANIRSYFKPTPVRLGLIRSVGSHFVPGLRYDDSDSTGLQTASYDSLARFLQENHLVQDAFTVKMDEANRSGM